MNKKNNQRYHDTEILMEHAMLEIMKTTPFSKITVKKICEKAQVNRSTFYAHFLDIYDMLEKMESELSKDLLKRFNTNDKNKLFSQETIHIFLQHIKEHQYFYKINLQTRKSFPLKQGYEPLYAIIESLCHKNNIMDSLEITYYLISFEAGFTMVLKQWVDNDCQTSEEEMSRIIKNCIPNILIEN